MARELQPCGTHAAYRRHLKRAESPCDPCMEAAREQKNSRKRGERKADGERRLSVVPDVESSDPDPLAIARENYALVTATLYGNDVSSSAIARLTERREQLADKIRKLNGSDKAEVSVLDQLAQRRKDRVANS